MNIFFINFKMEVIGVEVISVKVKKNDKIYNIGVDEDDLYSEGDGSIMITLDWQKIALFAIETLQDLRDSNEVQQVEENDSPPNYDEEQTNNE